MLNIVKLSLANSLNDVCKQFKEETAMDILKTSYS